MPWIRTKTLIKGKREKDTFLNDKRKEELRAFFVQTARYKTAGTTCCAYPNWGDRESHRPREDQFKSEYTELIPLWLNEAYPHPHKSAGAAGSVSHKLGGGAKRKVIIS